MIETILRYGMLALNAVMEVQRTIGASGGDPTKQATKLQLATAIVLAGAHAGEQVQNSRVQQISALVEMQVSIANALGLFGKSLSPIGIVKVPETQASLPLK